MGSRGNGSTARSGPTPLGAVVGGIVAGAVGTATKDLVEYAKYRSGGGNQPFTTWEFAAVGGWEDAPAPAKVGKRVVEGLTRTELPGSAANLVNNMVHWGYGVAWGGAFGTVAGSARSPRAIWGPLYGTAVWLAGYTLLPATGLYEPIWEYDPKTLVSDWGVHAVYGAATGVALRVLLWRSRR